MSKQSNGKSFIFGAVLGGIVGSVAALLCAPKAGKKMREDLSEKYGDVTEKTGCLVTDVLDHAHEIVKRAKNIAEDARECASWFTKRRR